MNWTLVIIIAASLVAFGIIAWATVACLILRTARKAQAEIRADFNKGLDSDFFRNSRNSFRNH